MNAAQQAFLKAYRFNTEAEIPPNYVPIFVEENKGGDPVFLSGYACSPKAVAKIEFKTMAPEGLWLSGGAVVILTPQGVVSIPDRRLRIPGRSLKGNLGPAAQGRSLYREGHNLVLTTMRELSEEVIVYTLAGEGDNLFQSCTEVVPAGILPKGRVDNLNLPLDDTLVFGQVEFLGYCRHPLDRVWIHIGVWDLRQLPNADRLRIIWDDDLPQERRMHTNPHVLDYKTGLVVGIFEGIQGYLPLNMSHHPVVQTAFQSLARIL